MEFLNRHRVYIIWQSCLSIFAQLPLLNRQKIRSHKGILPIRTGNLAHFIGHPRLYSIRVPVPIVGLAKIWVCNWVGSIGENCSSCPYLLPPLPIQHTLFPLLFISRGCVLLLFCLSLLLLLVVCVPQDAYLPWLTVSLKIYQCGFLEMVCRLFDASFCLFGDASLPVQRHRPCLFGDDALPVRRRLVAY